MPKGTESKTLYSSNRTHPFEIISRAPTNRRLRRQQSSIRDAFLNLCKAFQSNSTLAIQGALASSITKVLHLAIMHTSQRRKSFVSVFLTEEAVTFILHTHTIQKLKSQLLLTNLNAGHSSTAIRRAEETDLDAHLKRLVTPQEAKQNSN